jgi:hypothetical protein
LIEHEIIKYTLEGDGYGTPEDIAAKAEPCQVKVLVWIFDIIDYPQRQAQQYHINERDPDADLYK